MQNEIIQILSKITEISERTARTEEKIDSLAEKVGKLEEQDEIQNELIAEHIRGVKNNSERLNLEKLINDEYRKESENRISKLESTPKLFLNLKNTLLYLAAVSGAITTIWNLFKH